ncbi:divergent CRAL/TRIO domain-domain-containing protein [Clohesyomyces aquaticus]|uniref:Divergent CRAL/TRIO domain-domain-containing protein n=1 Tax=Clohesyomyces aquaticus TaxID=1231657 RepID=A0A1Y1ZFB2_9PLEO|nr:divergent CRAL/TRIO domain-domain-containing protein [Clohesyomyces aquaticus]
MSGMRAHLASRLRSSSLSAVAPRPESNDYSTSLARAASSILYRSPLPSKDNRPVYILNAAALPDSREADFDALLPYVLARLPEEDDLVKGYEYEVVFFAGDSDGSTSVKKNRPGWGWFLQAYHVLSRAMRKRLQKLYIVHEKAWVRILTEIFSTIVSPKFRRKIIHASTLSNLALHIPIEDLLIPPSTYLHDRRISDDIFSPYASGRRAFSVRQPLPISTRGKPRLPRVLRETTSFVLMEDNIVNEGLFRVPPHAKLKEVLKEAYDRGQKFIIWKDNGATLPVPHYPHVEHLEEIVAEVDQRDAYSVLMAAGMIKSWYADLRQPIFPPASYKDLKRLFNDPDDVPDLERLRDLVSPSSEWSFLPVISREIVTRHLLPLLDAVAAHQDKNKMTPENLAVCFAPALLCGPDQLEDAKMSSIVRRIITVAVEAWPEGLREACGVNIDAFKEDLHLPLDQVDWEDPLEGRASQGEAHGEDNQITGIILQDNESSPREKPPPLPPRSTNSQPRSASGRSSHENATKRKPAPPLAVPPRYSTIVSDDPYDVAESPVSYAAVTDGFAPPRPSQWETPDEKKSGTKSVGDSHLPPQIILPKRKALTAEQIDNAEAATAQVQARKQSESRMALPGLTNLPAGKAVSYVRDPSSEKTPTDTPPNSNSDRSSSSPISSGQATEFRRPSWPASSYRAPNITSLARPVHPATNPVINRPPSKSTSLPVPGPKPRTPSPALLHRMPSFETSNKPPLARTVTPRRLNMKKASVDDLRRLYEERAGTAKTLVEAGRHR